MKPSYDAVVIGTGFGGAVSACRLAQAGIDVGVFERGRRYPMKSFPRNWKNPLDGWLWSHEQGLFDLKPINEMLVVQGAGYGGGSLIYANVHLRVPSDVFTSGWPAGYSRSALDPYYDLVAYMLDITPISAKQPKGLPVKTKRMAEVAEQLGRKDQFCYPNIAVDFSMPEVVHKNKFGVDQSGCNHCGECDIGCNFHAKNTLDLNYLAVAEQNRADVNTRCEVLKIEPRPGGYSIYVRDHEHGGVDCRIEARQVFLCAGAVNSTELLLRCRDEFRTLPDLGSALGRGYSGNGDFLALAFGTKDEFRASEGPTITTGIVYDRTEHGNRSWFIFEEGGYPRDVARLVQLLDPGESWLADAANLLRNDLEREVGLAARQQIGAGGAGELNNAVFLMMGRDRANGRITLVPITHQLRVLWDLPSNLPLYDAEMRFSTDVAQALGGRVAFNPFWQRLRQPVSVHNLGGCVMADHGADGVTDGGGQVYGYPGLYVLDGAILPAATGVNPSHTIAAVAERNIEQVIRHLPGKADWQPPERALARPIEDPLTSIKIPLGGTMPPKAPAIGLQFTETMKGFVQSGALPEGGYIEAERAGQRAGTRAEFTLTISIPGLDDFLADKAHTGNAQGVVHVDGFTGPDGAPVSSGIFNLFVETDSFYERKMLYALPFYGNDGKPYLLEGFKEVKDHGHFDVWGSTSTLYIVIREGHDHGGAPLATGIMHILIPDFAHQLGTFHVTGTDSAVERAEALARFGSMFMGNLWNLFIRAKFSL
jgi:cholesterol oxidase